MFAEPLHLLLATAELVGVAVFAMSGGLTAARREMDPFGFVVVGTVTAIGGGTFRDLVLGIRPVFWVDAPKYLLVSVLAALLVFWLARFMDSRYRALLWADALGMALFTVTGTQKALALGVSPAVAVTMGVATASFGGVMRDVLCGESPLLFHKEVYATAALAGSALYVQLLWLDVPLVIAAMLAFALTLGIRALAIIYGWSIPRYHRPDKPLDGPPRAW
jgi:uncharacterized membrane protein YeiH